jgi:hypothetical protein
MIERPNRDVLNDALDEYRDAMRPFIVRALKRVRGKNVEDAIYDTLSPKQADDFERRIKSNGSIEGAIDIGYFPNLVKRYWREVFSLQFSDDMNVQDALYFIRRARNEAVHSPTEDLETEYTRTALFHIIDVLGKINATEAQTRVKALRDKLLNPSPSQPLIPEFSDDMEGSPKSKSIKPETLPPPERPSRTAKSLKAEKYRSYFQSLIDILREDHAFTSARKPQGNYCHFASGTTGIVYGVQFPKGRTNVHVRINQNQKFDAITLFDTLAQQKEEIATEFDLPLSWEPREASYKIVVSRDGDIEASEPELDAIRDWHVEYLLKFKVIFQPIIEQILWL